MRKALVGGAAVVREGGAPDGAQHTDVPQQTVTHHEREVEKLLSAPTLGLRRWDLGHRSREGRKYQLKNACESASLCVCHGLSPALCFLLCHHVCVTRECVYRTAANSRSVCCGSGSAQPS